MKFKMSPRILLAILSCMSLIMHTSAPENKISYEKGCVKKQYGALTEEIFDSTPNE